MLDQKVFAVVLAVSASLGIAACNEDKAASTAADKPAATTMEKAKEMAAVEAALSSLHAAMPKLALTARTTANTF